MKVGHGAERSRPESTLVNIPFQEKMSQISSSASFRSEFTIHGHGKPETSISAAHFNRRLANRLITMSKRQGLFAEYAPFNSRFLFPIRGRPSSAYRLRKTANAILGTRRGVERARSYFSSGFDGRKWKRSVESSLSAQRSQNCRLR